MLIHTCFLTADYVSYIWFLWKIQSLGGRKGQNGLLFTETLLLLQVARENRHFWKVRLVLRIIES